MALRDAKNRILKIDFVRFGLVGAIGFLVTLIFKSIFYKYLHLSSVLSIFLGSEMGVLSNFMFHEKWTYKNVANQHKSIFKKFLHFQASSLSGVVLFTLIGEIMVRLLQKPNSPIALIVAAIITMFWNFFWTKYFIFRGKTPEILMHPEDSVELNNT